MPEYIANGLIYLNPELGTTRYGQKITLTEEQAKRLGKKVVPVEVAQPETPLSEKTVKELRPLAKNAGIDGYYSKDRGELIEALEALQVEQVIADDEPSGD